jgi:hypothetical protein
MGLVYLASTKPGGGDRLTMRARKQMDLLHTLHYLDDKMEPD